MPLNEQDLKGAADIFTADGNRDAAGMALVAAQVLHESAAQIAAQDVEIKRLSQALRAVARYLGRDWYSDADRIKEAERVIGETLGKSHIE
jgi:hypothetical protein